MKSLYVLVLALGLQACATTAPRMQFASGTPTAEVNDRLQSDEDDSNPRFFVVTAINGVRVANAFHNSSRIGMGIGADIVPYLRAREVAATRARFTLLGRYITIAPIQELTRRMSGNFQLVEGEVDFEPQAGVVYRVNGQLSKQGSAVWIEEFDSKKVVSERITVKP